MRSNDLDLVSAKTLLSAGEDHAALIGVNATITVVDRGGALVAMVRMNNAWPGGFDLALGKARTASAFHAPSSAFVPMIQPGQPLYSVSCVEGGKYVIVGGGLPITLDGHVIGAVGVSGGSVEQDVAIAEAAIAKLRYQD